MLQGRNKFVIIPGLALLLPVAAQAEVFKCVGEDGQIAFSQTPCAPEVVAAAQPKLPTTTDVEAPAENDDAPAVKEPVERKKLAPAVAEARARAAEAHEEHQRRQCESNLQAQIDNINAQMRGDSSTARGMALKKKRSSLQARLEGC